MRTPPGILMNLLALSAMSGDMGMGMGTRGLHRGENPLPKNFDNSPDRAKGMRTFIIEGRAYHAGTLKGAQKMARRFKAAGRLS